MSMNNLFANETKEVTASARQLSGTAELTRIAANLAADMIHTMEDDIDNYREKLQKSTKDMTNSKH